MLLNLSFLHSVLYIVVCLFVLFGHCIVSFYLRFLITPWNITLKTYGLI